MRRLFSLVLPAEVNNSIRGNRLPAYLFMLLAIVSTVRSGIHLLAPDGGAGSIAGNLVQSTDANNHSTTIQYTDNFSDNLNRSTFALPTTVSNALGQSSNVQYDFSTEKPTLVSDPNSVKTSYTYSDPLDRLTLAKNAVGTGVESHSTYMGQRSG